MERAPFDIRRGIRLALVVLAVWVGLSAFMGVQFYVNGTVTGKPVGVWAAIDISVRRYLIYALLTFPVLWLCRRFSPITRGWFAASIAHVGGLVAFMVLYAVLRTGSGSVFDRVTLERLPVSLETALTVLRSTAYEQLTMYASIVMAALALQYHRAYREREMREAELRQQMAEYELQVLKVQLHPHFLFNAMNGIATLMARDTKTAREMLLRLSDLLRTALTRSTESEVSLREEIEFVKAYLEIEQMRFGERLRVDLSIERESLDARVPNMIIQPLVENAIVYGIARIRAGGTVGLTTQCVGGQLRILIENDGPPAGTIRGGAGGSGIGLGSARSRLSRIYGAGYSLRLEKRPQGGAMLFLEMPLRANGSAVEVMA